jgi:hypothetical protein
MLGGGTVAVGYLQNYLLPIDVALFFHLLV